MTQLKENDMMVIEISPNGSVEAMHRENVLDLGVLGKQEIVRATDIRFDTESQSWDIWPRNDECEGGFFDPRFPLHRQRQPDLVCACGFSSYEFARQVEVAWLEAARLHSLDPLSDSGLLALSVTREHLERAKLS